MDSSPWGIRKDDLSNVLKVCDSMRSRSKDSSISSERVLYAKSIFEKGVLHSHSLYTLLIKALENNELADIGGMCALSRCIIEAHNALCYLTEKQLKKEELEFRLALLGLNHSSDSNKISAGLEVHDDNFDSVYEAVHRWSIKKLEDNKVFRSLSAGHQKQLLRGRSPYRSIEYSGERPFPKEIESAVYNLFSHNAHSFSLGLHGTYGGSETPFGRLNQIFLGVEFGLVYLSHMSMKYWNLRSRAIKILDEEEKQTLLQGMLTKNYFNWKLQFDSSNNY